VTFQKSVFHAKPGRGPKPKFYSCGGKCGKFFTEGQEIWVKIVGCGGCGNGKPKTLGSSNSRVNRVREVVAYYCKDCYTALFFVARRSRSPNIPPGEVGSSDGRQVCPSGVGVTDDISSLQLTPHYFHH
jgi:hypothetical protein